MPTYKISRRQQRVLITFFSALFILLGTVVAIQFAKGYRPTPQGFVSGMGLLAANSSPTGSQIYLDGELYDSVTDDTITLKPGEYNVEIRQEGYTSWKKNLLIEKELVTNTGAVLFRSVPSINPLTFSGAVNLRPSPNGKMIAFVVASPSAQLKAGLYTLDLNDSPNPFAKGTKLIAENPVSHDFAKADLLWSPDSEQLIASFPDANYLLNPTRTTRPQELIDATAQITLLLNDWEQEIIRREKQLLSQLPDEFVEIVGTKTKNLYFSPDGERVLYTATASAQIPDHLIPPLPASNTQPENRTIEPGNVYVYDLKEDKNFLIIQRPAELPKDEAEYLKPKVVSELDESGLFSNFQATGSAITVSLLQDPTSLAQTIYNFRTQYSSFPYLPYQWFPTSGHILLNDHGSVKIIEYDGTNLTTLYSGIYFDDFVYPWPNGDKLIVLTNLTQNPNLPPNLYGIDLR